MGDLASYERDDPTFTADLRESHETAWLVARWLQGRGHDIVVYGHHERPSVEQMSQFNDGGADIAIVQKIDVKRRPTMQFTCREDFPYPTLLVVHIHTYDRAKSKPWAYVNVNASGTHAAIVMGDTAKHWAKVTKFDKAKRRERHYYECPVEWVRFVCL